MLAAVFQPPLFRPVGAEVHRVEPPGGARIQRAAAERDGVHLQPAGAFLFPGATDRDALTQETAGPGAAAPVEPHPQRSDEPVQGAGAHGQQIFTQVRVQAAVSGFIGGQPFGQQRLQARAAGLERREPDRFEDRQEPRGIVLPGPPQANRPRGGRRRLRAQGAEGRLAVIAQELNRLVEELTFEVRAGFGVLPSQPGPQFLLVFLAHVGVPRG